MHVSKHFWYVITCSRLEVNPTSYSLTVQIGISPLYVASQKGHSEVVDVLVKAGDDVHQAKTEVCEEGDVASCILLLLHRFTVT